MKYYWQYYRHAVVIVKCFFPHTNLVIDRTCVGMCAYDLKKVEVCTGKWGSPEGHFVAPTLKLLFFPEGFTDDTEALML